MSNLEILKWDIPPAHTHFFASTFQSQNLTLESIKRLEPGYDSHYMINMCPNLETLESERNSRLLLIKAALSAPKLKRFAMKAWRDGWIPGLILEVMRVMPQIESLGLLGSLGREPFYGENTSDTRLEEALDLVMGLEKLKHLDLPGSWKLGLGFYGGPWCGNAYDGKDGRIYMREVTKEGAEATETGGNIVLAHMPHLTSFTIGGDMPNITRSEAGMINVTWPWTGRMEEWLMKEVPDLTNFDEIDYDRM